VPPTWRVEVIWLAILLYNCYYYQKIIEGVVIGFNLESFGSGISIDLEIEHIPSAPVRVFACGFRTSKLCI